MEITTKIIVKNYDFLLFLHKNFANIFTMEKYDKNELFYINFLLNSLKKKGINGIYKVGKPTER